MIDLMQGDCVDVMALTMEDNSVDAIVTDPPYELGFMGKTWDATGIAYSPAMWAECLRVLKPGGHLLAFSGSRTYHRMVCAIEDAGFEIRDQIMWLYGSGFPKSLDVSKGIDKAAGAEREVVGARAWSNAKMDAGQGVSGLRQAGGHAGEYEKERVNVPITAPATEAAIQWDGWGTALKPAHEPIVMARKPLIGTVAANVLQWGTGGLNINACRIEGEKAIGGSGIIPCRHNEASGRTRYTEKDCTNFAALPGVRGGNPEGRWPANFIHDGSGEVLAAFPSGEHRFFYCAKASKKDRNEGCDALPRGKPGMNSNTSGQHITRRDEGYAPEPVANNHPTVKPTDLMAYLCRLVTPLGGVILDPFLGSGSTGKAAVREGFSFIGIEKEAPYLAIAKARIEHEMSK